MMSLSEWLIIASLAALVYHLATIPVPRRKRLRAIVDMRPPTPTAAPAADESDLEWIALTGVALAAIACAALLVIVRAGWV